MAVDLSTKVRRESPLGGDRRLLAMRETEVAPVGFDRVTTRRRIPDQLGRDDAIGGGSPPGVANRTTPSSSWMRVTSTSSTGRREFRIEDILKDDVSPVKVGDREGSSGYRQTEACHYVCNCTSHISDPDYQIRYLPRDPRPHDGLFTLDDISNNEVIRYPLKQCGVATGSNKFRHSFAQAPSVLTNNENASAPRRQIDLGINGPRWTPSASGFGLHNYDNPVIVYPTMTRHLKDLMMRDPKRPNSIPMDPEIQRSLDNHNKTHNQMSLVFDQEMHPDLGYDVTAYPVPPPPRLVQSELRSRPYSGIMPGGIVPSGLVQSELTNNSRMRIQNQQTSFRNPLILGAEPVTFPLFDARSENPHLESGIHPHNDNCQIRNGDVIPTDRHTINHVMFWTDHRHPSDVTMRKTMTPEVMMTKRANNPTWQKATEHVIPGIDTHRNKVKPYDVTWPDPPSAEFKRPRTSFTDFQLFRLREEFRANCYLSEERRLAIAKELGLGENQIKIWFQNNRAKLKKASYQKGEGSNMNNIYK